MADPLPDSITIPLHTRVGVSFPNNIVVSVGGGPPTPVTFDVGSIGLYVLEPFVGSDITYTGSTFKYGYEDGNTIEGPIVLTSLSFPEASASVETSLFAMGVITNQYCAPTKPDCPGIGQGSGSGREGVLGARYYNTEQNGVFNPLAFLPGNLNSGYIVAATGPTPGLIVGLTPYNQLPFTATANLQSESTVGQGGRHLPGS